MPDLNLLVKVNMRSSPGFFVVSMSRHALRMCMTIVKVIQELASWPLCSCYDNWFAVAFQNDTHLLFVFFLTRRWLLRFCGAGRSGSFLKIGVWSSSVQYAVLAQHFGRSWKSCPLQTQCSSDYIFVKEIFLEGYYSVPYTVCALGENENAKKRFCFSI